MGIPAAEVLLRTCSALEGFSPPGRSGNALDELGEKDRRRSLPEGDLTLEAAGEDAWSLATGLFTCGGGDLPRNGERQPPAIIYQPTDRAGRAASRVSTGGDCRSRSGGPHPSSKMDLLPSA